MARGRTRRGSGYVTVDTQVEVLVDDVLEEASDECVRAEYHSRFGMPGLPSFDLVAEIRDDLVNHRVNSAIARCEGHLTAARVPDEQRQAAYQAAGRAH
jgi:hypothetical protein